MTICNGWPCATFAAFPRAGTGRAEKKESKNREKSGFAMGYGLFAAPKAAWALGYGRAAQAAPYWASTLDGAGATFALFMLIGFGLCTMLSAPYTPV